MRNMLRMLASLLHLSAHFIFQPIIILIAEEIIVRFFVCEQFEEGTDNTHIGNVTVVDKTDTLVLGSERANNFGCIIARTVIADEKIPVGKTLFLNTFDLLAHIFFAVICG